MVRYYIYRSHVVKNKISFFIIIILANLQHLASLPTKSQQNIEEEKKIRYNKEMLEASLNQMVKIH